ncbi:MAG: hypothetical protein CVV10_09390 [Gammaproteobacteria bacterium HGW-Gammaproteobacteria-14]|nr:MAG: hypothetical protein CVV10_09390 [Gammaproteobacteria bacterium HGW-Gammaproteobacteria-14]
MGIQRQTAPVSERYGNVVPLVPRRHPEKPRIVRLSPELDGLELLYSNDRHPDKMFSIKILCWALRDDDSVVAIIPWLNAVIPCQELADPLNGRWEGYRLPDSAYMFEEAPQHKQDELRAAAAFFGRPCSNQPAAQEIPDTIGTHAVFSADGFHTISLLEVVSWRLSGNGTLSAMVIDDSAVGHTPILPGDPCLYAAQEHSDFRYFFQHQIANRIKERDPETLAAISVLASDDE